MKTVGKIAGAVLPATFAGQLLCAVLARTQTDTAAVAAVLRSWRRASGFVMSAADPLSASLLDAMGRPILPAVALFWVGAAACILVALSARQWWTTLAASLYTVLAAGMTLPFVLGFCGVYSKLLLTVVPYWLLYTAPGVALWVAQAALAGLSLKVGFFGSCSAADEPPGRIAP